MKTFINGLSRKTKALYTIYTIYMVLETKSLQGDTKNDKKTNIHWKEIPEHSNACLRIRHYGDMGMSRTLFDQLANIKSVAREREIKEMCGNIPVDVEAITGKKDV